MYFLTLLALWLRAWSEHHWRSWGPFHWVKLVLCQAWSVSYIRSMVNQIPSMHKAQFNGLSSGLLHGEWNPSQLYQLLYSCMSYCSLCSWQVHPVICIAADLFTLYWIAPRLLSTLLLKEVHRAGQTPQTPCWITTLVQIHCCFDLWLTWFAPISYSTIFSNERGSAAWQLEQGTGNQDS